MMIDRLTRLQVEAALDYLPGAALRRADTVETMLSPPEAFDLLTEKIESMDGRGHPRSSLRAVRRRVREILTDPAREPSSAAWHADLADAHRALLREQGQRP